MHSIHLTGDALWSRMERAVEKVQERLRRAVAVLESLGVPYAVVGGHDVRVWVAQIDEAAVRNTKDVDILIRRDDLKQLKPAMANAGFVYREAAGLAMFLDGPDGSPCEAVNLVFAGEQVKDAEPQPNPTLDHAASVADFKTLDLDTLVRMKLNSYRLKDRVHLVDMLDVGLIDASWAERLPGELGERLRQLIENPDAGAQESEHEA
ncbi:MAG: hypothetical protein ACE37H_18150 [Phycisphaeraceae bacterium]